MSESEAARVLVIGAVNVDLVVESDRLPGPGETVVGSDLVRHGGGKGANAAVAAARAGASVRFCGAVGDEDMGASALDGLAGEGVDTSHVAVIDGVSTGAALIVVDRDGENQIAVAAGANRRVDPGRCRGAVEHARSWDAGCVLVSTEIPAAAVSAALGAARDQGIPTVLNPAPVSAGIIDVLTTADVVTPNSAELGGLYRGLFAPGTTPSVPQMAHAVAEHCGVTVVVTLGADGALVADGRRTTPIPAVSVDPVVDTTGAGDTFNGVLAASLAAGDDITTAVRRGVAAGSLSVTRTGARTGMPTADAIARAMRAGSA
ncbi:ribokinase [Gordonia paraffinivorans]|uniref:ribokinase n=1 Tax=Gordonia paraffinivorans TaxID=175628 RepID=UPI000346F96F|nr:ribokinase [Gordonia paraffinivorans]